MFLILTWLFDHVSSYSVVLQDNWSPNAHCSSCEADVCLLALQQEVSESRQLHSATPIISVSRNSLYMLTLFTFLSALVQFSSEVFLFHTAPLGYGTISPLLVASEFLQVDLVLTSTVAAFVSQLAF